MKLTTAASLLAFSTSSASAFAPSNHLLSSSSMARKEGTHVGPLNGFVKKIKKVLAPIVDVVIGDVFIGSEKTADWSRETELLIKEIPCANTQFLSISAGPQIFNRIVNNELGDATSLNSANVTAGWKKIDDQWEMDEETRGTEELFNLPGVWTNTILKNDDLTNNEAVPLRTVGGKEIMQSDITNSNVLFPMDDSDIVFADMAQAERVFKDLKLNAYSEGGGFPDTYNTDFNMQTDESFSRIFFHGMCAPLIMVQEEVTDPEHTKYGPYMVDLTHAADWKIREPDMFKKFGARIHFDENQMVSAIYDSDTEKLVLPGDSDWEAAKMQAKVTGVSICTVREHLAQTHLMVANDSSREVVLQLHPEHPIRRLLSIFTYNSVSVNQAAAGSLIHPRCTIHRALPLDYKDGVLPLFENARITSVAYQPFPDREIKNKALKNLTENDESGFPYYNEGCEYYEIARSMVREWLDKAGEEASDEYALAFYEAMRETTITQEYTLPEYSPENMVDLVTTIVWTVTGYHEIIGHVADYFDRPDKTGFRLTKKNPTTIDIQSSILGAIIGGTTAFPAPQLLAKFPNYIGVGDNVPAWEKDVWANFVYEMGLQAKKVQQNDRDRPSDFEFKYYDPSLFECSVSV
uniref:Lipoxygenase domain-containing protein n=1 Tax=Chaetoceros debilis TaxID=122233 RepID=A0A7S3V6L4_9STRA|eukprot:CAMPEP_0194074554 /NCGR_PEP_ID=MMETSP0149-20130528/1648_1 /TAXON_ID=122233 /ORGANISM="Chaetoceros debilis, Strain MM31A-1" /LENGTH=633 /DNA_ID=CAMNT_0038754765 /DNA_START=95 /DNA_END=1996 /DNA_ORIENTATION=+